MFRRYREVGTIADWSRVAVTPIGSTSIIINNLKPSTLYEFQIVGKNALGDGMLSKIVTAKTAGIFFTFSKNIIYRFHYR